MFGNLLMEGVEQAIPLAKPNILIGRSPECDVVLPSSAVSGIHCRLIRCGDFWYVRDLNSTNGTRVEGRPCRQKKVLSNQRISVPRMTFRLIYECPKTDDGDPEQTQKTPITSAAELKKALTPTGELDLLNLPGEKQPGFASPRLPSRLKRIQCRPPRKLVRLRSQTRRLRKLTVSAPAKPNPDNQKPEVEKNAGPAPTANAPTQGCDSPSKPAASTRRYLGKLEPLAGGAAIALLDPVLHIGRDRKCEIRIKHSGVSATHCVLIYEDGYWQIRDMQSTNGVTVNGERVERRVLMPGDHIAISRHKYAIEYEPVGMPPHDPGLTSQTLLEKAGLSDLLNGDEVPAWISAHDDTNVTSRRIRLD